MGYVTKSSGERITNTSGMTKELDVTKARFDLCIPEGIPYNEQLFTRFAGLMSRGAVKYAARNWEKANSQVELDRFKESAFRHFMQWYCGEIDEDHAVAVLFNIMAYEATNYKVQHDTKTN